MKFFTKIIQKLKYFQYYFQIKKFPDKSNEAFTTLKKLIYLVSPEILIEFGSGKSTIYLAEYCNNQSKELISIENNFLYYLKIKKELRNKSYNDEFIKYVPIKNGWYSIDLLKKIENINLGELIFIDGPCSTKINARNSNIGNEFIKNISQNFKLIIIDDFDREEVRNSTKIILDNSKNNFCYFLLEEKTIFLAIKKEISEKCIDLLNNLKLEKKYHFYESFDILHKNF